MASRNMKYLFTKRSSNRKVGPIPVTTSPKKTCPDTCPLKDKGCYATGGPLGIWWNRISRNKAGITFEALLSGVRSLSPGQMWRHNQAGDLGCNGEAIDYKELYSLIVANHRKRGYTYTHHRVVGHDDTARHNRNIIKLANEAGFTVNLSADSPEEADTFKEMGIAPVTVVLKYEMKTTPAGNKILICPVQTGKVKDCATCQLCAVPARRSIVGFLAHGSQKGKIA